MSYIHGIQQTIMPDEYVELCLPFGTLRTYAATSTIHERGIKNKGLSLVVSGEVKIGNYGLDGSYQITTVLRRGDTFGEFTLYASLAIEQTNFIFFNSLHQEEGSLIVRCSRCLHLRTEKCALYKDTQGCSSFEGTDR